MNHLATRIAHSTIYQTAGKVVAVILGLLQVALLTRYFREFGYGQYATVTAYLGFALVIAELGLYVITVKEISREGGNPVRALSNAFTLRLVSSLIIIPLAAALAWFFFPYDPVVKYGILAATSAFVILSLNQVFVGVFQKNLANHTLVFGEIVGKAVGVLSIIIVANLNMGIVAVLAALNLSFLTNTGMTMFFARRFIAYTLAFDWAVWKDLLSQSWPIAFSVVLNLIYFRVDTIMLSVLKGPVDVGIYSLPYKILEVLLAFPAMFVGLLMPLMASSASSLNFDFFKKIIQNGFNFLVYTTLLVISVVMIFADNIIEIIAHTGFDNSASVFRILIFSTAFMFVGMLFGHAIPALNLQKKMIWGYLAGALAGVALYLLLIPSLSYYGAAIGTLISEFLVAAIATVLVLRKTGIRLEFDNAGRALAAAALASGLGEILKNQPWVPWYMGILGLVVAYAILLWLFRVVRKEEIKIFFTKKLQV